MSHSAIALAPPPRLRPLEALRAFWSEPAKTTRRLVDQGDGGLWRPLLVAAWLAGPLAWVGGHLVSGSALPRNELLGEFIGFSGLLGIELASLIGGLLLLRRLTSRSGRPRDLALAVAWGMHPLLAAVPLLLGLSIVNRYSSSLAPVVEIALAAGACVVAWFAFWLTLLATREAGRWSGRPVVSLLLVLWLGGHAAVIAASWHVTMIWPGLGFG